MEKTYLKINRADSVVVCLEAMKKGDVVEVDGKTVTLNQDTPAGHKVLITDAPAGTNIIKYGYPIGHAITDLKAGDWVNENNLKTNLKGTLTYAYEPVNDELDIAKEERTFEGYVRKNGEVGVRNEIWIVPTVGCVNGIAERLADQLRKETGEKDIDAVYAWHHNYGCSQLSGDHENTRKILRDITLHPNAGGVLVLGLGCENNQPDLFEQLLGEYDHERIKFLVTQRVDGDEVEAGMEILRDLYAKVSQDKRQTVPVSKLRVGLKCGGSDGFSGITANPLVGEFSDWLVAQGGTSILTEVPEMFGAETILMNRCKTTELFDKTVSMVNDFKEYFLSHGEPVGENPSPGNKAGGISTLEDKALGCTQKCGKAPVSGVLVLGLGCENNQPDTFEELLGDYDRDRIKFLVTQKVDGDEVEAGMEILRDLYAKASQDKRETVSVSKLRVGLKCGGSDGFSGITANPLVGEFSDWLVAQGGTSILTEVPEMFGAETILMNRCKSTELFDKTVTMVNDFKEYFLSHGEPVGENPSPGNKAGGISTLEDKALGCTQKCGKAPVSGVLKYGDRLETNGLNLLSAPGNDLVASTALASAGCQIVLFTTGRGTPFGTFVPTMKIATNPTLASRKPNWIDFSAGQLVEGKTMEQLLPEFIDKILAVASGEKARNEVNGYREISIFKNGVTL